MTPLYLQFLAHAAGINPNKHANLDLTAIRLLEVIAGCHYHEPLTVTEAMSLQEIASPATLHRKLDDLLIAGLITHQQLPDNRRTKNLLITQKAEDYFLALSRAMIDATMQRIKP
jgi:DNA-binding MarR family transcriptional regulator